ncbi:hypothetical protein [Alteromonas sp. KUL49]|uniref:hypothetical protein n=1 Tax=Alteromonas sp. KUL49 TaxID=2480798 RepID=UPI00102F2968|nr:hypothetical protein [Alteromonas sp. KUL49]TAP42178.1 hypothetical protein EYS00_00690 [Alteromonas sp. KUL49]GEA09763.1 hypothetical protein KUL49_01380 [Alteromonas sp. KUL49]
MHDNETPDGNENSLTAGGTIIGFLLFISGAILVLYGLLDIVVRIDSLITAGYLVVGVTCYKIGHALLNHFAVFKVHPERRRAPQR